MKSPGLESRMGEQLTSASFRDQPCSSGVLHVSLVLLSFLLLSAYELLIDALFI
jgi:hypothetical protein